jgi:hypothetical protein
MDDWDGIRVSDGSRVYQPWGPQRQRQKHLHVILMEISLRLMRKEVLIMEKIK